MKFNGSGVNDILVDRYKIPKNVARANPGTARIQWSLKVKVKLWLDF